MTKPARRQPTLNLQAYSKQQSWLLLAVILSVGLLETLFFNSHGIVTKSAALGALLSFVAQWVFTRFVFWHSGYRARRQIVSQLYRGQMAKWLIIILGFVLIFTLIKPLSAAALIFGFITMQLAHNILSAVLGNHHGSTNN